MVNLACMVYLSLLGLTMGRAALERDKRLVNIACVQTMSVVQVRPDDPVAVVYHDPDVVEAARRDVGADGPPAHVYVYEYTEYMLDWSPQKDKLQRITLKENDRVDSNIPDYSSVYTDHKIKVNYRSPRAVRVEWLFNGRPIADDPKLSSTNRYYDDFYSGQTDLKIQHPLEKRYFGKNGQGPWFSVKLDDGVVTYIQNIRVFWDRDQGHDCVVRQVWPRTLKQMPEPEYVLREGSSFDLSCETSDANARVEWGAVGEPLYQIGHRAPQRSARSLGMAIMHATFPGRHTCHVKDNRENKDGLLSYEELEVDFRVMSEEYKRLFGQ